MLSKMKEYWLTFSIMLAAALSTSLSYAQGGDTSRVIFLDDLKN